MSRLAASVLARPRWLALARPGRLAPPHPRWLALAAGGIAACGFRPLALWPLTILAAALLIALTARARNWYGAFLAGWLFGIGLFTVGDNWIATAFTYQANMPAWLGWIAVVLLSLYLAVYPALACLAAWLVVRRLAPGDPAIPLVGPAMPLVGPVLAACWIVTEWLRAWVFTGFAWNPLGVALLGRFGTPGVAMLAPYLGTYALSGVLVLLGAAFRAGLAARRYVTLLAGFALLGGVMELPARWLPDHGGGLRFTLVQPDLRQETLEDPWQYERNFRKLARLSEQPRPDAHRLVLWPESGLPDYLRDGYPQRFYDDMNYAADPVLTRRRIGRVMGPGSLLLTGGADLVLHDGRAIAARNSITALDQNGDILGSYAKAHLVPFGEYLGLRWLLEPLGATRLVPGMLDFWPGPGPRTIDFGQWGRIGMQLCYEITFSGQVVDPRHRPDAIFNPSNDGWFGRWGPPQHLAQARLRAIEEGLPVLRSTTTGISAVIDAHGIVRAFVPYQVAGRIDGRVPYALPPTPFARLGNVLPLAWAALLLVISCVAIRRPRR